jgi:hypothetical protein
MTGKKVDMPDPQVRERIAFGANGWPMLAVTAVAVLGGAALAVRGAPPGGSSSPALIAVGAVAIVVGLILGGGLTAVAPGEARVLAYLTNCSAATPGRSLKLSEEIAARVVSAGVKVIESRITHLAYAPEIAQAMLRRQQAGAVVAARQRIVEGAVGMVEAALTRLDEQNVVELDEERKAAMVSNLLVVLCSDHQVQPVVNTGSLYR